MCGEVNSRSRLRIAICGGGIAGVALASFLSSCQDVDIDIYETKDEIRTIGAGIAIWKRYWDLLRKHHDLDSECVKREIPIPDWTRVTGPTLRKSDIVPGFDFFTLDVGPIVLQRNVLLEILCKKLNRSTTTIRTMACLVGYTENTEGGLRLHFSDGTNATADLLIGADGVHSRVRGEMFKDNPEFAQAQFSGQFAYRMRCLQTRLAEVDKTNQALTGFKIWCGDGRHVTSNAVGEYIQITAYDNVRFNGTGPLQGDWVEDFPAGEIAQRYKDWEPDLRQLLARMDTTSRWAVHVVNKLPHFVSDRVALIGDAAHAMTPHQGLGGGQAIEDAYILSYLLANHKTTTSNLATVLQIYDEIRRPASQSTADRSLCNGQIYGFLHPKFKDASLDVIGQDLRDSCEWLLHDKGCAVHRDEAMEKLKLVVKDDSSKEVCCA